GLSAAALVLLVPGLAWSGARSGAERMARVLGGSALAVVLVLLAVRAAGAYPSPWPVASGLALVTVAGFALGRGREPISLSWTALACGTAALAVFAALANAVVPPLEDQDMELAGTAHGLATRQSPSQLTNRGTTHHFAHPPLLHLWVAGTF